MRIRLSRAERGVHDPALFPGGALLSRLGACRPVLAGASVEALTVTPLDYRCPTRRSGRCSVDEAARGDSQPRPRSPSDLGRSHPWPQPPRSMGRPSWGDCRRHDCGRVRGLRSRNCHRRLWRNGGQLGGVPRRRPACRRAPGITRRVRAGDIRKGQAREVGAPMAPTILLPAILVFLALGEAFWWE